MGKVFVIDGSNFSDYKGFCKTFSDVVLEGKYSWNGNLDAFNDILFGGFGNIGCGEKYKLIWKSSEKSKNELSYNETIHQLKERLKSCHPSNTEHIKEVLHKAEKGEGKTVFDWLIEIILENDNVTLILE